MSKIVIENAKIIKKSNLGHNNFIIELAPFSKAKTIKPGQFIHVKIPETNIYFRRAFSVYDINPDKSAISVLFKVFGRGTSLMAKMNKGDCLDVLGPLGNGFTLPPATSKAILAAGGVGLPPIYFLAKRMLEKGYNPGNISFFYGGASKSDLVDLHRVKRLGLKVYAATDDGSFGHRGLVTEAVKAKMNLSEGGLRFYACGPEGMLKSIDEMATALKIPGQLSLEAPMPCGVGICLGCILPLRKGGYTRVCREGPVYSIGEVLL